MSNKRAVAHDAVNALNKLKPLFVLAEEFGRVGSLEEQASAAEKRVKDAQDELARIGAQRFDVQEANKKAREILDNARADAESIAKVAEEKAVDALRRAEEGGKRASVQAAEIVERAEVKASEIVRKAQDEVNALQVDLADYARQVGDKKAELESLERKIADAKAEAARLFDRFK